VASSRDRQRKMARAKLDRQMARRAGKTRRRRQFQAGIAAAVALVLIVLGAVWIGGGFDKAPKTSVADDTCAWTPLDASNTSLKDVGMPPTTGMPLEGTQPMTITTNQGAPITVSLDVAAAPCSAASLSFLAGKNFYNNTDCHELTTEGALRCGDPSGTGLGGPAYTSLNENVPDAPAPTPSGAPGAKATLPPPTYPKGTVALIGNGPSNNGSQFLIFFKDFRTDTPKYPIVGTVTGGLYTLAKISKTPTVDNGAGAMIKPKDKITVQSLTVGPAGAPPAAPTAAATPSSSAKPSPSSQS
jgi:peptidyl-prolyl cis-trans isomerase B (cyclophilin B)